MKTTKLHLAFTPPLKRSGPVSPGDLLTLRMVIQQIQVGKPSYRIVVYGDAEKPRHADFNDDQALSDALRAAIPEFDLSQFSLNPMQDGMGSIVFADEVTLSTSQLSSLGLYSADARHHAWH